MYSDVFDAISIIGDWPEKKILSLVTAVQLSLLFRLSATSDGTIVIIIIIIITILVNWQLVDLQAYLSVYNYRM